MPQKKSAEKALRQIKKKTAKNKIIKKDLEFLFRQFRKAIEAGDQTKAEELSKRLIKAVDKADEKNIYHANKAARKKSRMMKKINALKK